MRREPAKGQREVRFSLAQQDPKGVGQGGKIQGMPDRRCDEVDLGEELGLDGPHPKAIEDARVGRTSTLG